jgi:hypothetical protein
MVAVCKKNNGADFINIKEGFTMVKIEYYDGSEWIPAGGPFGNEPLAWVSLGGDDVNYRTVDADTGKVLTDKSVLPGGSYDELPGSGVCNRGDC